ncbi:MAG: glycosyl-4,4'-diaponeurosporenoate acyltransferase [Chloroflexota bacterium]
MLFHLPTTITILIDITAWLVIQVSVSYAMIHIPLHSFNPDAWIYRQRRWEAGGLAYVRFFRVRAWKKRLPDAADIFKIGFEKKHLKKVDDRYFGEFIKETCRAEITHWVAFLFTTVFFLWNLWWVGSTMVVYALVVNLPCIVTQRYNRIRLQAIQKLAFPNPGASRALSQDNECPDNFQEELSK